jgi:outer membrane protein assembly factor BamE (lipoprotein component of BamABCDE complex)
MLQAQIRLMLGEPLPSYPPNPKQWDYILCMDRSDGDIEPQPISLTFSGEVLSSVRRVSSSREGIVSREDYLAIKIGMSKSLIRAKLGLPLVSSHVHSDRWSYVIEDTAGGRAETLRSTYLIFTRNQLTAIEESVNSHGMLHPVARSEAAQQDFIYAARESDEPASSAVRQEIMAATQEWTSAWMARNASAYFDCYSPRFKPSTGMSRGEWEQSQREFLQSAGRLHIALSDYSITLVNELTVAIRFKQQLQIDSTHTTNSKVLGLEKIRGQWKIQSERIVPDRRKR